jgi:hypothetical protein
MEIRALLESQLTDVLNASGLLPDGILAVTGVSDDPRPERYVAIVCPEPSEPRGFGASRVLVEFRAVAPLYGNHVWWLQQVLSVLMAWTTGEGSPLLGYENNGLVIMGCSPPSNRSEVREKQRAEIIAFRVGAAVIPQS